MTFTKLAYWKVVRERFTKWVFGQHYIHRLRIEKRSGKYLLIQCSQIKQPLAEKRTPSVWRRSVRKTYNGHFKPPALWFPVKQEKNEYLPEKTNLQNSKIELHTLKARRKHRNQWHVCTDKALGHNTLKSTTGDSWENSTDTILTKKSAKAAGTNQQAEYYLHTPKVRRKKIRNQ